MRKATVVRIQPVWIEANQATYWKLQACVVFIDRAIRAIFPFLPSAVHLYLEWMGRKGEVQPSCELYIDDIDSGIILNRTVSE